MALAPFIDMVILIAGSSGFIGRHLAAALRAEGHRVIGISRSGGSLDEMHGDFARDITPEPWLPRLANVDVVINAVGIIRETGTQTFETIHTLAPRALFAACARTGVRRVIQISALGADTGTSGYFSSKRAADEFLATLPLDWTIVQPSLVYGEGGTSASMFTLFASLPLIPVPGRGDQRVQPIHIDDLVAAIVNLCFERTAIGAKVALVGPREMSYRDMLLAIRAGMGLHRTPIFPVPMLLMRIGARIAELSPRSLLDRETLRMLEAGNVADPSQTTRLLGRPARAVASFVDRDTRDGVRRNAQLSWLLPLMRYAIAAAWIWTAIVSFGLYPHEESLTLLYRTGVSASIAPLMLYGAAGIDLALGFATLFIHRYRWIWLVQIALIVGYTIIITFKLPEFWLHPYGPILKNLPMLAALYMLYTIEAPARSQAK
jgi:nucleoside-diphosphate-sugar epimerase